MWLLLLICKWYFHSKWLLLIKSQLHIKLICTSSFLFLFEVLQTKRTKFEIETISTFRVNGLTSLLAESD